MSNRFPKSFVREQLLGCANSLPEPFLGMALIPLSDDTFWEIAGSTKTHHAFEGGLAEHTLEVVYACTDMCKRDNRLNRNHLIVAAIWHDFAKTLDYAKCDVSVENPYGFKLTFHHRMIRHLSKSYALFMQKSHFLTAKQRDEIGHMILAHHGRRDQGSPVEPYTKEAWALHLADMQSAFIHGSNVSI